MNTKLNIKSNILINYTAIIFIMVIFFSLSMGFVISRLQENHLLLAHIEFYPELIKVLADKNPDAFKTIVNKTSPGIISRKQQSAIEELIAINGISDAAIINLNGEISATSNPYLSLSDIKINPQFAKARSGFTGHEYLMNGDLHTLRLYVPVKTENSVIAVVFLSEEGGHLSSVIHEGRSTVWIVISIGGLFLYFLLFYIFYHSYRTQSNINKQLKQTQDVTIYALGYQAELRDLETGKHIERTSAYVGILAKELKKHGKYKSYMSGDYILDMIRSAPLHDIGKVAIPDSILRKPGKLTEGEFLIMQSHPLHGSNILQKAEERLSFPSFFKIAIQMCKHHHEKWNGSGYPSKLSGDNIPLSARIMALADVYDALKTVRPYKEAFSHEKCLQIIREESGISFDPDIVNAFLNIEKEFEIISMKIGDA